MNFCSVRKYEKRPFSFSALPYTQIKLWLQLAKWGRSHIYAYGIPIVSRRYPFLKMSIHTVLRAWLLTWMDRCVSFLTYVFFNESLNLPKVIILMATTLAALIGKHPRIPHWLAPLQASGDGTALSTGSSFGFLFPLYSLINKLHKGTQKVRSTRGQQPGFVPLLAFFLGWGGWTTPFAQSSNPARTLCLSL